MTCIREQCRCLKVGPSGNLDALSCLVQHLADWSWGEGLLCFFCYIYTSVLGIQWHTSSIRWLCFSCWIPSLDEQVSIGLFINRVEANLQKGIQGIELWAKVSVEPELQVLLILGARHPVYFLQMSLCHCDFAVHCMSMYSVTCELLVISSHFIWDTTYLPHRWSAHSNLTGAAVLK